MNGRIVGQLVGAAAALCGLVAVACADSPPGYGNPTSGAVTALATAEPIRPSAPFDSTAHAPPPALTFQFLDASGTFVAPPWDDREIGQEQKAADRLSNPAWVPFAQCLSDGGVEVRSDRTVPFDQHALDAVLARVNAEHPDTAANRRVTMAGLTAATGSARTYLACAQEWLTKTPQQIFQITGVPNEWYPPKSAP